MAFRRARARRRGGAAVECAAGLPVLLLFLFASLQACSAIYLRHGMKVAAYEAARSAVLPSATNADAENSGMQVLADRRISGGSVAVGPSDLSSMAPGDWIEVRVSAPSTPNILLGGASFFSGQTFSEDVHMMKEY